MVLRKKSQWKWKHFLKEIIRRFSFAPSNIHKALSEVDKSTASKNMDHCCYRKIISYLRTHNQKHAIGEQHKTPKTKSQQSFETKENDSSPFVFNRSDNFATYLHFNEYSFTEVILLFCLYQLQLVFSVIQIKLWDQALHRWFQYIK